MSGKSYFLVFALFFAGCSDPQYIRGSTSSAAAGFSALDSKCAVQFRSQVCLYIRWLEKPTEIEPGRFTFRAYKIDAADGFPTLVTLSGLPSVNLWMPSMSHGSDLQVEVKLLSNGVFEASNVHFVMPGEWHIQFQLLNENVVSDQAILPYVF